MISPSIPDTRLSGNAIGGRPELLEFGKVIVLVRDSNVFNYSSQSVRSRDDAHVGPPWVYRGNSTY